ncbi:hypothetical protein DICPUDRAFT_29057 [Dictyostelium purpureum]|uniref:THH1/TOM1/TOM3 domain-containing protein n=1 Tax=Dictyostelium purpureum TaxID=5786 RepID=F0ZCY2_DICPU|nr:uncharacterized protein DICPUDRAFT_29057 [Dictyostelium purpureum]EGC38238.1 hypothetical protein DICPUDRAFT_29057 [Dictyostelium purpureum]|eukprot:XP_003285276.1 hypothetical protein DICPUDRAFT_29057 [Dictyostelium purpureum]
MVDSFFTGIHFPLFILYTTVTLIVSFQIGRILYNKHNIFSFRFGFLVLGFVWGLTRAVFWCFFDFWGNVSFTAFFYIPINIQFATFSLLVLFYAHVVHRATWERFTRKRFTIAYSSVNFILLVLQISFYGWRLRVIMQTTKSHLQSQLPLSIIPITFFIFLCFTSRCIFDFFAAFGAIQISLNSGTIRNNITIFVTYLVWEILPYILILVLFWRIPTTHIGGLSRRSKNVNSFAYPPQTAVVPGRPVQQSQPSSSLARLFLDPQRYDSDDETTGLLYKGSPILYSGQHHSPYSTTPLNENIGSSSSE